MGQNQVRFPNPGSKSRQGKYSGTLAQEKFEITPETPPDDIIRYFENVAKLDNYTSKLDHDQSSLKPKRSGGAAEVCCVATVDRTLVAVKCIYVQTAVSDSKAVKRTARELEVWSKLRHKNILPLLGLAKYQGRIAMVSNWMSSGSIVEYLKDKPDKIRYGLSHQVVEAVAYLHTRNIVHGDLKGENVLVSDDGVPMLTDFGLTLTVESNLMMSATGAGGGTLRFMAPELFSREGRRSKEADVYALGMTTLQILTGQPPFAEIQNTVFIMDAVKNQQEIPQRPDCLMPPSRLKDEFWDIMTKCWVYEPARRALVAEIDLLMAHILQEEEAQEEQEEQEEQEDLEITSETSVDDVIDYFERVFELDNYTSKLPRNQSPRFTRHGGRTDVYCVATRDGKHVAVMYAHSYKSVEAIQRSARELEVWSTLAHKNILPLLGVAQYRGGLTSVSRWMNSSIVQFVNDTPDVNRYVLSQQVVEAVAYLHARDIIHGDIKGSSVLMSKNGIPKLSGFNMATMPESRLVVSFKYRRGGTPIWMAPELLKKVGRRSKEADVYALGMTILEIITGGLPFAEIKDIDPVNDVAVKRKTPRRPALLLPRSRLKDAFWNVMTQCWAYEPAQRLAVTEVAELIENALDEEEADTSTDDESS